MPAASARAAAGISAAGPAWRLAEGVRTGRASHRGHSGRMGGRCGRSRYGIICCRLLAARRTDAQACVEEHLPRGRVGADAPNARHQQLDGRLAHLVDRLLHERELRAEAYVGQRVVDRRNAEIFWHAQALRGEFVEHAECGLTVAGDNGVRARPLRQQLRLWATALGA